MSKTKEIVVGPSGVYEAEPVGEVNLLPKTKIAVIGGSGLYEMDAVKEVEEISIETPFGFPSDNIIMGKIDDRRVAFLPRHGRGHRHIPSKIPFRANIYALKKLGVEWVISLSAVGSLKEDIYPGDLVMVDQFIDWTKGIRPATFFCDEIAAHIGFADPVCSTLSSLLYETATALKIRVHHSGTYLCIEGPQFSTRAESRLYRSFGADVIGMTNIPEAKLAREAEMSYATIAMATDYDVWHESEDDVTVEGVLKILNDNITKAQTVLKDVIPRIPIDTPCPYHNALNNVIMTRKDLIPLETKRKLHIFIHKYL